MRVLLIDVNCKTGSTGKIVYDIYNYINSIQGHEAAILYGRGKRIKEKNIHKFGFNFETLIHAFLTRITGLTGYFSFFSTKKLIKYIEKFKPDVVHIHEIHGYFLNINKLFEYLKTKKIKVVHTLHCEFSYTGKCGHADNCLNWKKECGNCPKLGSYVSTLFFDFTRKMLSDKKKAFIGFDNLVITTPSSWLSNRASQSFFNSYRILTINNGIDTDVFSYRHCDEFKKRLGLQSKKIVLSIASDIMSENKGGELILELSKHFGENYEFILIGSKTKKIVLGKNYRIIPSIFDKALLAKYYSIADVFLICSKNETFPTTCIEAQCCGLPIVGFDVGGVKETSVAKDNIFVKFGDLNSLKNAINEILLKSLDKTQISTNAIEKFSNNVMAKKYFELYNSLNVK